MEVRIGIRDVAREVVLESDSTPQQVRTTVSEAIANGHPVVELEDDKGRTVVVPTAALGYVEIGAPEKGRVGFGTR